MGNTESEPPSTSEILNSDKIKMFSREDVAKHNNSDDAWIILHGKVYNITSYIDIHPGGLEIIKNGIN